MPLPRYEGPMMNRASGGTTSLSLALPLQMFAGLVIGLVLALVWPAFAASLQPIGTAFVEAIRMIIIPLVVASVTLGTYKMGRDIRQLGRVAAISFGWFYFATFCAIVIALVLDGIFHPGVGVGLVPTGKIPPNLAVSIDWVKFLLDLIPSNIIAVMAAQKLLPTLVFSVLFGVALAGVGPQAKPVVDLLEAIMAAMFRLTRWIVALSPLAILAIMAFLFATQGLAAVLGLAKLIGLMYVGLAIEIVIFCVMLKGLGDRPLHVFRRILEPLLLAFTTRSSEVTLPVHMKILQEMGIPNKIVSVVLPLGYSFNQDGSILYQALAGDPRNGVDRDRPSSRGDRVGRWGRRLHGYGSHRGECARQHGCHQAGRPFWRPGRDGRGSASVRRTRGLTRNRCAAFSASRCCCCSHGRSAKIAFAWPGGSSSRASCCNSPSRSCF